MTARKSSTITVTDMFCGAGGSSTGAKRAGADLTLAMNHWSRAIETHNTNHPEATHVCADIRESNPRRYPRTTILIASPECTSHSLSKGRARKYEGQPTLFEANPLDPAEERSRATMWDVPRFAEEHDYELIIVENVVDICYWRLLPSWLEAMRLLGYEHQFVFFNSQFAWPTPQSRDRFYGVFWKSGNRRPDLRIEPLAHCPRCDEDVHSVQSWKDQGRKWGRYGRHGQYLYRCPHCAGEVMPYYFAAANAIDWRIPAPRIGDRKRALADKTRERVRAGLHKFAHNPFVTDLTKTSHRLTSLGDVLPTATCVNGQALVMPYLIQLSHNDAGEDRSFGMDHPFPTQTARDDLALITPYLVKLDRDIQLRDVTTDPCWTITAGGEHHAMLFPPFMIENHGTSTARSLEDPLGCVMAGGEHHAIAVPPFLVRYFTPRSGNEAENALPITNAMPTMTANYEHYSLAIPPAFLSSYYGSSLQNHDVREPMATLSSHDRHALVEVGRGRTDITEGMIDDCGFRMLEPHEIQAAMAFPSEYVVTGNRREKVKQLGNAVTPPVMELLTKRCIESLEGRPA